MIPFTEFAPAKINLALHILGRRADGFHEIDSIVTFADVGDELRFEPTPEFSIETGGPFANLLPPPEDNIITKTYRKVAAIAAARGKMLPPVTVYLTKNLPVAAGIGGGSADAAAAMRSFLRLAEIEGMDSEIERAALSLGADVPACLLKKTCRMQGAGERIVSIENFTPRHAVLVNPLIAVKTSAVFQKLGLAKGEHHGAFLTDLSDPATWRNDLTLSAVALVPAIADVIAVLENQRHLHFARMSGSGATCFGVFESPDAAKKAAQTTSTSHPQWWVRQVIVK